jgi:hypothetical protein
MSARRIGGANAGDILQRLIVEQAQIHEQERSDGAAHTVLSHKAAYSAEKHTLAPVHS